MIVSLVKFFENPPDGGFFCGMEAGFVFLVREVSLSPCFVLGLLGSMGGSCFGCVS